MTGTAWVMLGGMTILLTVLATDNTAANIITAIAAVITASGGLALGASLLVTAVRTNRKVGALDGKVDTVHTIVNQQRTDAQRYNIALSELLKKHGIEIPVDQSLPVTDQPDAQPGQPGTAPEPSGQKKLLTMREIPDPSGQPDVGD